MTTSTSASNDKEIQVGIEDLPLRFKVKYVGSEVARGLWGIKYTRRPVDIMVAAAKNLPASKVLPHCEMTVFKDRVSIDVISPKATLNNWHYPIDSISYGVQDLVFTHVFAMIVVKDNKNPNPFEVHAFVCDSRNMARKLTFALAAAFQDFSRRIKESSETTVDPITTTRQNFAIDLRTPEELQENVGDETEV